MNTLDARRRLLGRNVYKKTTEGNPAIAQGSLARMYPGITMQGWTEQDSTTGAQLFDKNTVDTGKYVSNTNGNIYDESSGNETSASDYILVSDLDYICATITNYGQWMAFYDSEKTYISGTNGYASPISVPDGAVYARFTVLNDYIDSFMVNAGQTLLPYEPYTGRKPSPSPEYPQEIVSAGKYNEDTQKWEYEITIANEQTDPDKNQTVTLTSDRPLTKWDKLEKRNGQWGWVFKSVEIVLDESEEWGVYAAYEGFSAAHIFDTPRLRAEGFCESFICETAQYNVGKDVALWLGVNNYSVYAIRIPQYNEELPDSGLQEWKDWLSENPITILTYADEETFVPLGEPEQEQMNALYTFRPTTVLSNDCECNMSLTYKTKKSLEVAT